MQKNKQRELIKFSAIKRIIAVVNVILSEMNIVFVENYAEHKLKMPRSKIDGWLKSIYSVGL